MFSSNVTVCLISPVELLTTSWLENLIQQTHMQSYKYSQQAHVYTHTLTHTLSALWNVSLLIASLPAISSKSAPYFWQVWRRLSIQQTSSSLLFAIWLILPPSISLPVSSLICFLIWLDWIGHGEPLQCSFTPLQDKVGVKWLDKIENYLNGYTGRSTWYQAVQLKFRRRSFICCYYTSIALWIWALHYIN